MPTLSDSLINLDACIQSVLAQQRPISHGLGLVEGIISILGSGLYPGLSTWTVFRLLQRLEISHISSFPLARRLRFASKTVSLITSSLAAESDAVKSRAFVRCALNTGHLTAIIELLSCIGTTERRVRLEEGRDFEEIRDVWALLLGGGREAAELESPVSTLGKILQPLIADGINILRCPPGGALEGAYRRFIQIVSQIGGPSLSVFLEMQTPGDTSLFNLSLYDPHEGEMHLDSVYPSDICFNLRGEESSPIVKDHQEDPTSPNPKKKTVVKKVIIKKKIVKTEPTPSDSIDLQLSAAPLALVVPDVTAHATAPQTLLDNGEDSPFDSEIRTSDSYAAILLRLETLMATSVDILQDSTGLSAVSTWRGETHNAVVPGLGRDWADGIALTLTSVPAGIKQVVIGNVESSALRLNEQLS